MTNKIVEMMFGSHLYGLNSPNSDKDYKGVVLPTVEDIILQNAKFQYSESTGNDSERNTAHDVDMDFYSLHKFLDLAVKGETVAIDMLHAPDYAIQQSSKIWEELRANRSMFYTSDMKAFVGYVKRQADKYGIKGSKVNAIKEALNTAKRLSWEWEGVPEYNNITIGHVIKLLPVDNTFLRVTTKETKEGTQTFYEICGKMYQSTLTLENFIYKMECKYEAYGDRAKQAANNENLDWKAISHALRAGYQAKDIYTKGDIIFPLDETDYLMDVKQGRLDFKSKVEPELERIVKYVHELADNSNYPKKVNQRNVNELLLNIYKEHLGLKW